MKTPSACVRYADRRISRADAYLNNVGATEYKVTPHYFLTSPAQYQTFPDPIPTPSLSGESSGSRLADTTGGITACNCVFTGNGNTALTQITTARSVVFVSCFGNVNDVAVFIDVFFRRRL